MNADAMRVRSLLVFISAMSLQTGVCAFSSSDTANVLTNPSFDDLLLGWTVDAGDASSVSWVPNFGVPDRSGQTLGAVAVGGIGNSDARIYQCVPVTEGVSYQFSFSGLAFCENGASAFAAFSDSSCISDISDVTVKVSEIGQWQKSSVVVQAPVGATAAVISLIHQGAKNCDEAVYFDEIFFGDQIFASGFE